MVDSYDVKPIGYTAIPEIVYGFGFSLQWKAFDFSAFFQGVGHVNFSTRTDQTQGFIARNSREANLFSDVYDNYWTPERLDAKYPRLFIGTNNNNNQNSSFWMANGRYMRLKNLEIGYTLPKHISQKMAMQNMRVYLSGREPVHVQSLQTVGPRLADRRHELPQQPHHQHRSYDRLLNQRQRL